MYELLIFPFRGVGPFALGSSREAVTLAVGRPALVETSEIAGAMLEEWHFDQFHITLSFMAEDGWKLSGIGVHGSNATLNGVRFVSQPTADLQTLCMAAKIHDMRPDGDYGEFGTCYFSESAGLMLWAVDDHVTKLDIFPRYDDLGNQPYWPDS